MTQIVRAALAKAVMQIRPTRTIYAPHWAFPPASEFPELRGALASEYVSRMNKILHIMSDDDPQP